MQATFTDLGFRDSIPGTHFQVEKNVEHGLEGLAVMRGGVWILAPSRIVVLEDGSYIDVLADEGKASRRNRIYQHGVENVTCTRRRLLL